MSVIVYLGTYKTAPETYPIRNPPNEQGRLQGNILEDREWDACFKMLSCVDSLQVHRSLLGEFHFHSGSRPSATSRDRRERILSSNGSSLEAEVNKLFL